MKEAAGANARSRSSAWPVAAIVAITAVAAYLRVADLLRRDFIEYDQAMFALVFRQLPRYTIDPTVSLLARPLFFVIAKVVSLGAGSSRIVTLAGDSVLGAVTPLVLFFLVRRVEGVGAALLSALFLALSPSHVWYARVGNGYAEAVFFFTAAILLYCASQAEAPAERTVGAALSSALAAPESRRELARWTAGGVGFAVLGLAAMKTFSSIRTAFHASLTAHRALITMAVNDVSALALVVCVIGAWSLIRSGGIERRRLSSLAGAGLAASAATLSHYSFFLIAVATLPVAEALYQSASRFSRRRVAVLVLAFVAPLLLFQVIGYPTAYYLRDLAHQITANSHSRMARFPTFFFRMAWYREGIMVPLAALGLAVWIRRDGFQIRAVPIAMPAFALFALAIGMTLNGGFFAGRMTLACLPFWMMLAAMAVGRLAERRRIGQAAAVLVAVGAIAINARALVDAATVNSSFGAVAGQLARELAPGEHIAVRGQTDPWAFYLGPDRVLALKTIADGTPPGEGVRSRLRELGIHHVVLYPNDMTGGNDDIFADAPVEATLDYPMGRLGFALSEAPELFDGRAALYRRPIRIVRLPARP